MSYCIATYRIHDDHADFHKKAQSIAVGMTVGSWTELPQAKRDAMKKHLGEVYAVEVHESPDGSAGTRYADIRIAYPDINFSRDIPALLVTVFGKISMDGRIKLTHLDLSSDFLSSFPGPKFGIDGIRELLGVNDRPLLMSIFKSVIGLSAAELREQFMRQAQGGVDLVKDDEILFENDLTPITTRVRLCIESANIVEQETGRKLLYAANLTGRTFQLRDQALRAIDAGANALLFNVLSYGYDVLQELSADPEITVPIMAHPALAGAMYPSPHYGIAAPVLLGQLMRLAGADLVLFPSPYGSVTMPREENLSIRDELHTTALGVKRSMPVPSAGIHPGLVPKIIRDFGRDVVVNAGGGIHGHPLGTEAGGQAFVQAIDAAMHGVPLSEYAEAHPELKAALELWGGE
ncbi:2,3-diketo-5-methylthiopentyl-1-phosphate enolase [Paenibacillus sp. F411]|uniref:2,3-diketo-5-methylthiopentyl-1-phosphate enolase n=1 Tax=Paenibacillus algicola TaxID=2565926 RepID=A0A4P8XJ14_9BACL|nr:MULTISPECIES: 2,3-diketo-5-methylthiopentyl-1-phosphate enolase [Paenibacillus]MBO2943130.1 2,3-diketo-5-methylthiopentyl-1-phosphate enolase [Paenibacillus sp. F411]QCT02617.1 2,3-diketo-5-methylthiopentyl-1-phosphate enolase [Paenibacillus algicola]